MLVNIMHKHMLFVERKLYALNSGICLLPQVSCLNFPL